MSHKAEDTEMKSIPHFLNTYADLPENFYQKIRPDSIRNPKLILWNDELAKDLKINLKLPHDKIDIEQIFSGQKILPTSIPLAMAYAGHQFGHFTPVLGDGRAHLLGELYLQKNSLSEKEQVLCDIHLKGSGVTQYSRRGDGKCALGPALREYFVSEFMHSCGVPTTQALSVIQTGDLVQREKLFPGAILARVTSSLIRVGTFEYFASQNDIVGLKILFSYCINRLYPHLQNSDTPLSTTVIEFFRTICDLQAKLIAQWMSLGFIHGVMNTDNFSIAGVTLDYGPCAFLDETDITKVFSSIDQYGRYAYNQQPTIGQWNLTKLADCLYMISSMPQKDFIQKIQDCLSFFQNQYQFYWLNIMSKKLGLLDISNINSQDLSSLITAWIQYLNFHKIDFTLAHRNLVFLVNSKNQNFYPQDLLFDKFYQSWKSLIGHQDQEKTVAQIEIHNPLYIPRNHILEKIIQAANENDFSLIDQFLKLMRNPFAQYPNTDYFLKPPTDEEKINHTFCGT